MSTTVSERCPNCEAGSGEEVSRMTDLDLAAIRQRVHGINNGSHPVRFSEARDDLNALLAKIDRLNATIQRVRDIVNDKYLDAGQMDVMLHRALEGGES